MFLRQIQKTPIEQAADEILNRGRKLTGLQAFLVEGIATGKVQAEYADILGPARKDHGGRRPNSRRNPILTDSVECERRRREYDLQDIEHLDLAGRFFREAEPRTLGAL